MNKFSSSCSEIEKVNYHFDSKKLLGMVKTGLEKFGQIIVFSSADEAGDVVAGQRTRARVQVIQQQAERVRIELDDGEFRLSQLGTVDLLDVGADAQSRHG